MDSACIRCGSTAGLTTRPLVTWRGGEPDPEVRLASVATCDSCRVRLRRLRDEHAYATTPPTEGWRRYRAWDVAGALLVLSAGYAIAAAAGWVGDWSWWIAAALLAAAVPASLISRRLQDAHAEGLEERYRRTGGGREHEAEERQLREAWRRHAARIERDTGFATEHRSGDASLRSLDERALVDPDTWSPRRDGRVPYCLVHGDGSVEHRELPPEAATR